MCQNSSQTFKSDNLVLVQNLESVISSPSAYKITNKNVLLIFTLSQLPSTRCQQDYKQQQNANSLQLTIKQILRFNISMLQAIVTIKKITASLLFGFLFYLFIIIIFLYSWHVTSIFFIILIVSYVSIFYPSFNGKDYFDKKII